MMSHMGFWERVKKEFGSVQITKHLTVAEFLSGSPPEKPRPKKLVPRFCGRCGQALPKSAMFCARCGARTVTTVCRTRTPLSRFERPTHQPEQDKDMVRVDLTEECHSLLMRSLENDDSRFIEDYLKARIRKDKQGYFLRLPYLDVRLVVGALNLLRSNVSNEVIRIIPDAFSSLKEQNETQQAQTRRRGRSASKIRGNVRTKKRPADPN